MKSWHKGVLCKLLEYLANGQLTFPFQMLDRLHPRYNTVVLVNYPDYSNRVLDIYVPKCVSCAMVTGEF